MSWALEEDSVFLGQIRRTFDYITSITVIRLVTGLDIFTKPQFLCVCVCVCVCAQSCPTFCGFMDCSPLVSPLSMGFSRQEYWIGLPFPTPGHLLDPGVQATSLDSLPLCHLGGPTVCK